MSEKFIEETEKYKLEQLEILIKQKGNCNGIPCEYCYLHRQGSACKETVYNHEGKLKEAKTFLVLRNFKLL